MPSLHHRTEAALEDIDNNGILEMVVDWGA